MIGYLIFGFLLILASSINTKQKAIFIFLILLLFAGLREGIAFDYYMYYGVASNGGVDKYRVFEPIPKLICEFSTLTTPHMFFWITSFIIYVIYIFVIKKESSQDKNFSFRIWYFICFPYFFLNSLGIIRQFLAFSFILCAIVCTNKKIYKLFFILLASLCHQSAIVCLLLFLPWGKLSKKCLWIILLSSIILGEFIVVIIMKIHISFRPLQMLQQYISIADIFKGGAKIKYLVYLIAILSLIKYDTIAKNHEKYRYYIGIVCLGAIFQSVLFVSPHAALRICTFFFQASILYIPNLFRAYKVRMAVGYPIFIALFVFFIYTQHTTTLEQRQQDKPGYSCYYPYRTYL